MMPRVLAAFALLVLIAIPAAAGDLDSVLTAAMEGTKTPALGALVMHGGKVVDEGVRGERRNDRPDKVQIGDTWLIGSDAKPMTATLIARLVDQGKLKWTTPLSKMLPGLATVMRPEYRDVTLVQLLTHRAGLPHDFSDLGFFNAFFTDKRPLPDQRLSYISLALQQAPIAPPGTTFSYSNTGFVIAAVIAERTMHESYETLMRKEVFGPLGMKGAGYGLTPVGQPQGHLDGKPVSKPEDSNPAMFAPAGNIHMSLGDWAKFCLDQMAGYHGHGKLLSRTSYRMMTTPIPGEKNGLAWGITDSLAGRKGPVLMHAGSDGNWDALVALFPKTQDGVLTVANAGESMGGDKATKAALKALLPGAGTPE